MASSSAVMPVLTVTLSKNRQPTTPSTGSLWRTPRQIARDTHGHDWAHCLSDPEVRPNTLKLAKSVATELLVTDWASDPPPSRPEAILHVFRPRLEEDGVVSCR